jgi:type II secretory pathway pseudopilin PulG
VRFIKTPIGIVAVLGLAIWLMERSFRREKDSKQEQLRQLRAEIEQLKNEQK